MNQSEREREKDLVCSWLVRAHTCVWTHVRTQPLEHICRINAAAKTTNIHGCVSVHKVFNMLYLIGYLLLVFSHFKKKVI